MDDPSNIWDGILLGAGHNALVAHAYLGKAGLPGYNCAQVLHADLGLPAPWAPRRMQ